MDQFQAKSYIEAYCNSNRGVEDFRNLQDKFHVSSINLASEFLFGDHYLFNLPDDVNGLNLNEESGYKVSNQKIIDKIKEHNEVGLTFIPSMLNTDTRNTNKVIFLHHHIHKCAGTNFFNPLSECLKKAIMLSSINNSITHNSSVPPLSKAYINGLISNEIHLINAIKIIETSNINRISGGIIRLHMSGMSALSSYNGLRKAIETNFGRDFLFTIYRNPKERLISMLHQLQRKSNSVTNEFEAIAFLNECVTSKHPKLYNTISRNISDEKNPNRIDKRYRIAASCDDDLQILTLRTAILSSFRLPNIVCENKLNPETTANGLKIQAF